MDIEYGKVYGIYSYDNKARLDIGSYGVKKEVPASHDSWATRLIIKRLDGESKGPVSSTHKIGIFSENGTTRLDIGTDAMQHEVPITHESWATKLIIKKLNGESSGTVNYGDIIGIFSENGTIRLDIGSLAMKKEVPASHESWATILKIDLLDPIVDFDINHINYLVDKAIIESDGRFSLYRQTVSNKSDVEQVSTISGSETVSESSGWNDTLGFKAGVKTEFKAGIPILAEGKIEVSAEVSNTYQWNGSTTTTKTWGFNTSLKVPPHETGSVIVSVSIATIIVPYQMHGTFIHKSGKRSQGVIEGIYTGTNSNDLQISYTTLNKENNELEVQSITI